MQNKLIEENNSWKSKLIQPTKTEKEKENESDIIELLSVSPIHYDPN